MSEEYRGVKFKTIFTGTDIPSAQGMRNLKRWCAVFQSRALAPAYPGGSYGNLSYRPVSSENSFIITASGISLCKSIDSDAFVTVVHCDTGGQTVYAMGVKEPSSETFMHYHIYRERKDVVAVFHGHSCEILAAQPMLNIPSTPAEAEYGTPELASQVSALAKEYNFFIIRNHGFVSLGASMYEAGAAALDILMRSESPWYKKMMKK
jgi:ribulose-5-phosphate 4-epimerase/fuculose-1-phosphate aldolase